MLRGALPRMPCSSSPWPGGHPKPPRDGEIRAGTQIMPPSVGRGCQAAWRSLGVGRMGQRMRVGMMPACGLGTVSCEHSGRTGCPGPRQFREAGL